MQHAQVLTLFYCLLETVLRKIIHDTVEEGNCLLWKSAVDTRSPVMAMPYIRMGILPDGSKPHGQIRVRTLLLEIFSKKQLPEGAPGTVIVTTTCRNKRCICPACASYMPRSKLVERSMAELDIAKATIRSNKIREARRHVRSLTDEQALRVKTETGPEARRLSREFGVSASVIYQCRSDNTYRDISPNLVPAIGSPWAGLAR